MVCGDMATMLPRLALLCLLAGCGPLGNTVGMAANVATVPVFGRTAPDLLVSAVTGKDCSMVRVEQGKTWCREDEPPPAPPPFCTRSLGVVDCWENTRAQPMPARRGVADGPSQLTLAQERNRTRGWPGLGLGTPQDSRQAGAVGP